MMRYAIISGGKIVNLVEWDGSDWSPPNGQSAVIAPADVGIGWAYNGSNFVAPAILPLTPEQQTAKDAFVTKAARLADTEAQVDQADLLARLKTATPAQIDSWIDANVTTLPAARAVLKAIVKYLARDF